MPYSLLLSPSAKRDLKKLPVEIQESIIFKYLPEIQREPYKKGMPLAGAFKNERSFHFGRKPEYRIIYFIDNGAIIVTIIGSREGIYKKAKQRH